jgi:competence protein ComEC
LKAGKTQSANFTAFPMAWFAAFFAFGICFAKVLGFNWEMHLATIPIAAAILLVARLISKSLYFNSIIVLSAFAIAGAWLFQIDTQTIAPNRLRILYDSKSIQSGEPVEIEGILTGKPELAVGGFFIELQSEKLYNSQTLQKVTGIVRLFAPVSDEQIGKQYDDLQLRYGTRIRVSCLLRRDERFLNPGVTSAIEILDQKEIDAIGAIKSPLLIERLEDTTVFLPMAWLYERRQDLILDFKELFSSQTSGVLIASLLNNRFHLDKSTADRFRENGTFHALVISGMHITFIGSCLIFFLQRFTKNRWWHFVLATVFLWGFAFMVGAEVPVTRATIMFSILLFSRIIFRDGNLLNALGASGLLLLIWRPSDLFDQSFQLTFSCLIAIVAMGFPMLEKIKSIGEWHPTSESPFPPNASKRFRSFCELLYWSEKSWRDELLRSVWTCKLLKNPIAERLESAKLQKPVRFIFESLVVSFFVQLWLLPLMILYFHRISIVSLLFNVWVGALMAIESILAIFAVFLSSFSSILAAPFIFLTEIANWILIHAGDFFVDMRWSSIRIPEYSGFGSLIYIVYFFPLIALSFLIVGWKPFSFSISNRWKIPSLIIAIFSIIIIFHPFSSPKTDGKLHIDYLDVGQGDSALITFPNGETLLVDGGGKPNFSNLYVKRDGEEPELFEPDTRKIGESVVSEFLWAKGYDTVNYILATHADADHIQGLTDVARNFNVTTAIFGRFPGDDPDFVELDEVLLKRNIPTMRVSRGERLRFGEATIDILYPESPIGGKEVSDNNHSLVFVLTFKKNRFLFTGDIEAETENLLLRDPSLLKTDIVKVAHHGSKTSSIENFIKATSATYAVISVGRESQFGHPNEEVVNRWQSLNAKVLQTGQLGTISVESDGNDYSIKQFLDK